MPDSLALFADFVGAAPDNLPQWRDADYDGLVELARRRADRPSQEHELLAAERRLLGEAPVAPIYFNARNWLMSPRVQGWLDDPLWTRFYNGVYLETK